MRYDISVEVEAAPERIWTVLTDVERWPEWTASMTRVDLVDSQPFGLGSEVLVKQPKLPETRWRVTLVEPGRSFTWQARRPGVTMVAAHRMAAPPGAPVKVTLSIAQTGFLAPPTGVLLAGLIRRYVTMEAYGLKRYCETG